MGKPNHCLFNSIEATKLVSNKADFKEVLASESVFDTSISAQNKISIKS